MKKASVLFIVFAGMYLVFRWFAIEFEEYWKIFCLIGDCFFVLMLTALIGVIKVK